MIQNLLTAFHVFKRYLPKSGGSAKKSQSPWDREWAIYRMQVHNWRNSICIQCFSESTLFESENLMAMMAMNPLPTQILTVLEF